MGSKLYDPETGMDARAKCKRPSKDADPKVLARYQAQKWKRQAAKRDGLTRNRPLKPINSGKSAKHQKQGEPDGTPEG